MLKLATIEVTGDDAFDFLQGQLSNDLRRLDAEASVRAAWCNPKGRVLWFGEITGIDRGFAMTAPAETAEDIVSRLTVFRFRAKVEFEIADQAQTLDPDLLIAEGRAWIGKTQMAQFTPHMLNLDLLDAISLDKGCYTGQEIVARTHYRGATRRRTLRFGYDGPVTAGDKVLLGDKPAGEVLNVATQHLLAVVPVAKAREPLSANGSALSFVELAYLDI